jgi:hypothetical protein
VERVREKATQSFPRFEEALIKEGQFRYPAKRSDECHFCKKVFLAFPQEVLSPLTKISQLVKD